MELKGSKTYENLNALVDGKIKNSILWAGRFIDWKRPEYAIYVAEKLKKEGYDFSLNLIGVGDRFEKIKTLTEKKGLNDYVKLLGAMSPEQVRENMEKTEIFLFTSTKQEGWGAVLNESMNSVCAVVASKEIGSVPYLIDDGKNGFTFKSKKELYKRVKRLIDNPQKRKDMGKDAYETLTEKWNAEVAADRLLTLTENLNEGKDTPFTDGPCSKD